MSGGAPARPAPGALLIRALDALVERCGVGMLDALWTFPTVDTGRGLAAFAVAVLNTGEPAENARELWTVQVPALAAPGQSDPEAEVVRQGVTPAALLPNIIRGLALRAGSAVGAAEVFTVAGDAARWSAIRTEWLASVDGACPE